MKIHRILVFATAAVAFALGAIAADNPWFGTWKMDHAQSKLTGDVIHFGSGANGDMTLSADGHSSTFKLDGQPRPNWNGDEAAWKKVDDNNYQESLRRNGMDLATVDWTISGDGKALKEESKGTNPDGSSFDNVTNYARVAGTKGLAGSWKSTKETIGEDHTFTMAADGTSGVKWDIPAIKGTLKTNLDGKDVAPDGPTIPKGLTVAVLKASPHMLKVTEKMDGKVIQHSTMTLSADGKKITEVVTHGSGTPATEVWLKQ